MRKQHIMSQQHPNLLITHSDIHGRGVFTTKDIGIGEIIEICPVIVMPVNQVALIHATKLHDYYFLWGENEKKCAIVLGYGSIYNHSYDPNAEYYPNYEEGTLSVFCFKDIEAGEEITVNYNGEPDDNTLLWFDKKEEKRKQ